jgi:hypothetical protein
MELLNKSEIDLLLFFDLGFGLGFSLSLGFGFTATLPLSQHASLVERLLGSELGIGVRAGAVSSVPGADRVKTNTAWNVVLN